MKALLAGVSIALLAGTLAVQADDAKYVKLTINNKADLPIQVYVVDHVASKTYEINQQATPGGTLVSQAMVNKDGMLDFTFSIWLLSQGGHQTRCWAVSTNPNGQTELTYDVDATVGTDHGC
jgi:hypothetical protein